jgi:hypothetical protein
MTQKIAFGYKQRVGKDTACDYLVKQHGGAKLSFAEPIYAILNYAQETCRFEKGKDRRFLQYIGTEWARQIDSNVWINLLIDKLNKNNHVFVSDLRFRNEMDALKAHGFTCINIIAEGEEHDAFGVSRPTRGREQDVPRHQSNVDLDDCISWDYTIRNDSSIESFYVRLDDIVAELGRGAPYQIPSGNGL